MVNFEVTFLDVGGHWQDMINMKYLLFYLIKDDMA